MFLWIYLLTYGCFIGTALGSIRLYLVVLLVILIGSLLNGLHHFSFCPKSCSFELFFFSFSDFGLIYHLIWVIDQLRALLFFKFVLHFFGPPLIWGTVGFYKQFLIEYSSFWLQFIDPWLFLRFRIFLNEKIYFALQITRFTLWHL